jgi:hypothetical protein
MPVIDSQVHAYEANPPKRPWHTIPNWPDHVRFTRDALSGTIHLGPFYPGPLTGDIS